MKAGVSGSGPFCCEPEEHGSIEADVFHDCVMACILDRIEAGPSLLRHSILAMSEDAEIGPEIVAGLGHLEADPRIVRQVTELSRATVTTVHGIEPEAFRLTLHCLIRRNYISGPSLPLDQQVRIVWRIPEPETPAP
ncbi:hypothetical protein [Streptomyces sp. NPDC048295]|uniref:hypothetical protein n=1 Tax=Streptomyces sp. NPDC048295 TaxID=3154617 RepID=UPI00342F6A05